MVDLLHRNIGEHVMPLPQGYCCVPGFMHILHSLTLRQLKEQWCPDNPDFGPAEIDSLMKNTVLGRRETPQGALEQRLAALEAKLKDIQQKLYDDYRGAMFYCYGCNCAKAMPIRVDIR